MINTVGIGSELVRYAINKLKEAGCVKVNLQVRSTNTEVTDFYKSLGFAIEDRVSMACFIN